MAAYYSFHCVLLSYVAYYLGALGIPDLHISLVVSGACALGGIMQIVAGRIADRSHRWNWKKILVLCSFLELAVALLRILIPGTLWWQSAAYGLMIVIQLLMMPLVNLSGFDYSSKGMHVNFGIVRGFGSAAFAAASFIAGKLTDHHGPDSVPVISAVLCAALVAVVLIMPEPGSGLPEVQTTKKEPDSSGQNKIKITAFVRKYPVFFVMVIGQVFMFVFHNMLNTFLIRVIENVGGGSAELGIALAVAAAAELPILFLYSRISGLIKPSKKLIVLSCAFFVVRAVLYLLAADVMMIYLIQLLQSVTYGLMIAAKATYADESMDQEDKATGQALMTFSDAFGAVAGIFIGGLLLDQGGTAFMLWGGVLIAAAGTIITICASAMRQKPD